MCHLLIYMKFTTSPLRFKQQFKSLHYYSMPTSILFVVRKRLNLVYFAVTLFSVVFLTLL